MVSDAPTMLPTNDENSPVKSTPASGLMNQQPKVSVSRMGVGGVPRPSSVSATSSTGSTRVPESTIPTQVPMPPRSGPSVMVMPCVAQPPAFTEEQIVHIKTVVAEAPVPITCPVFSFGFGGKVVSSFSVRASNMGGSEFLKRSVSCCNT